MGGSESKEEVIVNAVQQQQQQEQQQLTIDNIESVGVSVIAVCMATLLIGSIV